MSDRDGTVEDSDMGAWVYCRSHVGPHTTGWCTVRADHKIRLSATNRDEAMAESWGLGLPIYGYCDICHKYVVNEDWYRNRRQGDPPTCPEHGAIQDRGD